MQQMNALLVFSQGTYWEGCHLEDMQFNVERNPREVDCGCGIQLAQDRVHFVLAVLSLQILLTELVFSVVDVIQCPAPLTLIPFVSVTSRDYVGSNETYLFLDS